MIQTDRRDRVAVIALDRPDKHNALNAALCDAVREAVEGAVADGARAIVLTGNGPSFCAGADLNEVYSPDLLRALRALLDALVAAPVPVVAAVNGPAIGGGTQLAIASDFRVIAPTARFGVPTAKLGLAVDPWTIRRLTMFGGNGVARRLLVASDQLSADEALACGLADRAGSLEDALEWATSMVGLAPLTVAYNKAVLNDPAGDEALQFKAFQAIWASEDREEGRVARAERRAPEFKGR
ncbi:MAG: enoyl-CoA hydratase [Sporichthyaceae bacterium]